jgi:hypothetical protein
MSEKTRPVGKPVTPRVTPTAPKGGEANKSNNLPTFQNPPPPPPKKEK